MKSTAQQLLFLLLVTSFFLTSCKTNNTIGKKGEPIFVAPIGIQAYSFRNYFPKDMIGTLDRIQAMGITEIESGSGKIAPEDYRKLCAERGISIPSTGANFNELRDTPMAVVERAKALGANYVMCAWIPHDKGNFGLADADKAVAVFNKAGKILADNDLTFCYHPHGYEFLEHEEGTLLDYLMEQTNPEHVSFEMDIFWVQFGGGDPVVLLEKYGDRWKLMHLKDMKPGIEKDLTGGTNKEYNVPLGTGQLDMEGILKAARKIGIAHYFIEDESQAVVAQVPESITYLKSLRY
jgi:sugar phosphate isomerase/epimerase